MFWKDDFFVYFILPLYKFLGKILLAGIIIVLMIISIWLLCLKIGEILYYRNLRKSSKIVKKSLSATELPRKEVRAQDFKTDLAQIVDDSKQDCSNYPKEGSVDYMELMKLAPKIPKSLRRRKRGRRKKSPTQSSKSFL